MIGGDRNRKATWAMGQTSMNSASGSGRSFEVFRWDARRLPLRDECVDRIVTDFPWGNRTKLDYTLLPLVLREMSRVLRPGGRAVMLLLRTMATQVGRLVARDSEAAEGGLAPSTESLMVELVRTLPVSVGGWPVAVIIFRKMTDEEAARRVLVRGDHGQSVDCHVPQNVKTSAVCCTVEVNSSLAQLPLASLLTEVWPSLVPNESSARRAIREGRLRRATSPDQNDLWWRSTARAGQRLVFLPQPARGPPRPVCTPLLWEAGAWIAVVKPQGLPVFHSGRSLASAARHMQGEQQTEMPEASRDKLPPWMPAFDGSSKLGGAWLIAKDPVRALPRVMEGGVLVRLTWRAILCGRLETGAPLPGADTPVLAVHRMERSIRYGHITEVEFTLPSADTSEWRAAVAEAGHPVVGDRPHCDGPAICAWVSACCVRESLAPRAQRRHLPLASRSSSSVRLRSASMRRQDK